MPDYATAVYSRFINDLGEFNICRCFLKLDPASLLLTPTTLLGIGSFRGVIMAKIKLTKSAVDAAQPQAQAIELRDTLVPGFLCKITPAGRKVFMLHHPAAGSQEGSRCEAGAIGQTAPILAATSRSSLPASPPTSSATRTWASCSGSSTRSKPQGLRTTSSRLRFACNSSSLPAAPKPSRSNGNGSI